MSIVRLQTDLALNVFEERSVFFLRWSGEAKKLTLCRGLFTLFGIHRELSQNTQAYACADSPRRRECPFLPTGENRGNPSPCICKFRKCSEGQGSRGCLFQK